MSPATKRSAIGLALVLAALCLWAALRSARVPAGPEDPLANDAPVASRATANATLRASESRELAPDPAREAVREHLDDVRVRVVDTHGAGREGVMISFAWRGEAGAPMQRRATGHASDARGMVLVPVFRRFLDGMRSDIAEYGVCVEGLVVDTAFVPLDIDRLPRDPIVIVLSACGSVKLALSDARGLELRQGVHGLLRALDAAGKPTERMDRRQAIGSTPLRFGAVALGGRLSLSVSTLQRDELVREIDGPTHDGEEVLVAWTLPDDRPVVTGLVVEPNGAPAAERRFAAAAFDAGQWLAGDEMLSTDASGRFAWAISRAASLGNRPERIRLDERGERGLTGRRAGASVAHQLNAGMHDLGTLTLAELPVILTCQVIDEAGEPLEQAWITIARRGGNVPARFMLDADGRALHRALGNGRTEFRSATLEPALVVRATQSGFMPSDEIPFARGARDLRIVLTKGGSLLAHVLGLPDGATLELRRDDAPDRALRPEDRPPSSFEWTGLAPGAYALIARLPFDRDPMVLLAGLRIESEKRVVEIDLRTRMKSIVVRAIDETGRAIHEIEVFAHQGAGAPRAAGARGERDGTGIVSYVGASASFVVSAPSYRPREVRDAASDVTVTLTRGVRVRAKLTKVELPTGVSVYCHATRRDGSQLTRSSAAKHQPGEIAELTPLAPGAYELVYVAAKGDKVERIAARVIEVLDQQEPQLFELACSPGDLAEALEKVRH